MIQRKGELRKRTKREKEIVKEREGMKGEERKRRDRRKRIKKESQEVQILTLFIEFEILNFK